MGRAPREPNARTRTRTHAHLPRAHHHHHPFPHGPAVRALRFASKLAWPPNPYHVVTVSALFERTSAAYAMSGTLNELIRKTSIQFFTR